MNPATCARSGPTPTASALYRHRDDVPTKSLVLKDLLPRTASTFLGSARRGRADGARIPHRLERIWEVNVHMHAGMP
jgi:hypothetical protein